MEKIICHPTSLAFHPINLVIVHGLLRRFFTFVAFMCLRLRTPDNYRRSFQDYVSRSKYQAAAKVWAEGVPWQEAMVLAEKAIEKAFPGHGKAKGKGAKGKGGFAVPKAKGKGRG